MRGKGCVPLLVLTMLTVVVADATAAWEHTREGWMIGVSIGGGTAKGTFDTDQDVVVSTDRTGGVAFGFRAGYAVRPDLVLGLEGNGWGRTETERIQFVGDVDVTTTLSVGALSVSWFPGAGGFFVRGGLGWGTLSQEIESGNLTIKYDESGFGVHGAVGYEWRLTRTFALGPQVDLAWMNIGTIDVEDENGNLVEADVKFDYVTFSVLANWYF